MLNVTAGLAAFGAGGTTLTWRQKDDVSLKIQLDGDYEAKPGLTKDLNWDKEMVNETGSRAKEAMG